jgi:nucleotide-binding universal stress UspA family protein
MHTKPNGVSDAPVLEPTRIRSLLVPVDLTPVSDRVLRRAMRLPLADDARITLLHVVPDTLSVRDQRSAERDAAKALAAEVRDLRQSLRHSHHVDMVVTTGATAAKEISAFATRLKAELIVMGRGNGRMSDVFLGSTAERVIRQSQLPVLVVRLPARKPYCRPALALEADRASLEIIRLLLRVVPAPRPPIAVIHAFDDPYHGLIYPSLSDEAEERKSELHLKATKEVERLLAAGMRQAKLSPTDAPTWKSYVRYGSPRVVIENTMRKVEPVLLVLGTRGHTGVSYVFFGTVAGDVLRQAKCDVLVVPPASSDD